MRGITRAALTGAAAAVCVVAVSACGGSSAVRTPSGAPDKVVQMASRQQIALLPRLGAGDGGWCVAALEADGGGCPTYALPARLGPFAGPIVLESWSGRSSIAHGAVDEAIVLTTGQVAAVSLPGRAPVATRSGALLPGDLRAAVIELRSGGQPGALGAIRPPAFPRTPFIALSASGQRLAQSRTRAAPLEFSAPSRPWNGSSHLPHGVCSVLTRSVPLSAQSGSVLLALAPHKDVRGREFIDCAQVNYNLGGWPVQADVLLDAAQPGSTPAPLPAIRALVGHQGIFVASSVEGPALARRIPGAWLLLSKGRDQAQRLLGLAQLDASVELATR